LAGRSFSQRFVAALTKAKAPQVTCRNPTVPSGSTAGPLSTDQSFLCTGKAGSPSTFQACPDQATPLTSAERVKKMSKRLSHKPGEHSYIYLTPCFRSGNCSGDHTVKITCCRTGACLRVLRDHERTPWVVSHPLWRSYLPARYIQPNSLHCRGRRLAKTQIQGLGSLGGWDNHCFWHCLSQDFKHISLRSRGPGCVLGCPRIVR